MLSGIVAMGFYTIPRMTRDVDIVIEMGTHEVEPFTQSFQDFYIHRPSVEEETQRRGMFNLIDLQTNYKIGFILRKPSEYAAVAFSRRRKITQNGKDFWVIAIEDLIIAKLLWIQELFSERQANDIHHLLRNPEIDKSYLLDWCEKMHLKTFDLL